MVLLRHARRYREIISVLIRHGSGWLLVELGFGMLLPFHWGLLGHPRREDPYSGPEHLRMAFEELGPTFIKLAQILSTRPDLVSPVYAREFAKLQDRVPARSFAEIEPVLASELEVPYRQAFPEFDPAPIASASIGQVYRARLADGKPVVVKIRKPGIADVIAEDKAILRDIVRRIIRRRPWLRRYDIKGMLDQFFFVLDNELDYVHEGQNADRFRKMFEGDPHIFVPTIYWEYSTARVLVMDEVIGIKVDELEHRAVNGRTDRQHLAKIAVDMTFKQIFEYGYFHADPHPGNFVITRDDSLGIMDFGMFGYLDNRYREAFLVFTYEFIRGNTEGMMDALWNLGVTGTQAQRPMLRRDLDHLLFKFRETSLAEIAAGDMLSELMAIAYRHQLSFPPDLANLFKVLGMLEGVGSMIDPDLRFFDYSEKYFKNMYKNMFSPENIVQQLSDNLIDLYKLGNKLPRRLSRLLQRVEFGDIGIEFNNPGLENDIRKLYKAVDRIALSVMLSLFLIAAGIFVLVGHFVGYDSFIVRFLFFSMVAAGLVTLVVLVSVWRQQRF
jgi:ubiquinone biosynthesis protein